ncbi:MAG: competence/damage-inducible protein A [Acidobacteriota bacterium]|nr:competence/damage-inducible protein A [Acidobacteriota bacterium]
MKKARAPRIEVIAVGSELLTDRFQDTNSLYLSRRLADWGLRLSFKTVVGDEAEDLGMAIRSSLRRADLILIMGGLGPTEDDRTRETLAGCLKRRMIFRPEILKNIEARFRKRRLPMPPSNRKQAYLLQGAEILPNPHGTAPGQWIRQGRKMIALLPGPPRELIPMFEDHILPRLEEAKQGCLIRRVLKAAGLGESTMEERLRDVYPAVPPNMILTTLAAPGDIEIQLSMASRDNDIEAVSAMDRVTEMIESRLGSCVYARDNIRLESAVAQLFSLSGLTLACAESCTGGLIGHRLTDVPGSSAFFLESVVSYANTSKIRRLGVPRAVIEKYGAVSRPVAEAMAEGIRKTSGADIGLAVTGIAGPSGGTLRKPVGLVFIALADEGKVDVVRNVFPGNRNQIKAQASQKALDILRLHLQKILRRTSLGQGRTA